MNGKHKTHVWDLPIRLFHWILVLTFCGLWYTGKELEMDFHIPLGFLMLGLLIFRLLWGFAGSHHARFANFPLGLKHIKVYFSQRTLHAGHNPLGSWSVICLLSLLLIQVTSGLFASDGYLYEGPLSRFIDSDLAEWITDIHRASFDFLLALIGLHIAAVFYYTLIKRQDILPAMITGHKYMLAPPVTNLSSNGGKASTTLYSDSSNHYHRYWVWYTSDIRKVNLYSLYGSLYRYRQNPQKRTATCQGRRYSAATCRLLAVSTRSAIFRLKSGLFFHILGLALVPEASS